MSELLLSSVSRIGQVIITIIIYVHSNYHTRGRNSINGVDRPRSIASTISRCGRSLVWTDLRIKCAHWKVTQLTQLMLTYLDMIMLCNNNIIFTYSNIMYVMYIYIQ